MTTPPISVAAMQAAAAYGVHPRGAAPAAAAPAPMPQPTPASTPAPTVATKSARHVVRSAPGLSVELSADARAALIAVQSAASGGAIDQAAGIEAPSRTAHQPATPLSRPGGRLNLTI